MSRRRRRRKSRTYAPIAEHLVPGPSVPPHFDLGNFQQTIERSVWQYAAIFRLAGVLGAAEWRVNKRGTTEQATGTQANRLRAILNNPNKDKDGYALAFSAFVHLCLDGECYMEKGRNGFGEVAELFVLNPWPVKPRPDTSGRRLIAAYEVHIGPTVVVLQPEEVIPILEYNPRNPYRGMSATAPLRREIGADILAALYNESLLRNGGRTGGILRPKEGEYWTDKDMLRLRAEFENAHRGAANSGRFAVLSGAIDWSPDTMSPKDMDFVELRKFARDAVSAAYGVPPLLIQSYEAATYANANQQIESFYDHTGRPKLKQWFGALNKFLVWPDFGENLELAPDWVGIANQIQDEGTRTETAKSWYLTGLATLNECRAKIGQPGLGEAGEIFFVPLNGEIRRSDELRKEPAPLPSEGEPDDDDSGSLPPTTDATETNGFGGRLALFNGRRNGKARSGRRTAIAEAHSRALTAAEAKLAGRIRGFLIDQQTGMMSRASDCGDVKNAADCFGSIDEQTRAAFDALAPAILETIRESGDVHLSRMGSEKAHFPDVTELLLAFDLENPRIRTYLEEVFFSHLEDLNETTFRQLRTEVDASIAAGEGVSALVGRINRLSAFTPDRAERIARTETIGAFNLGASEAFRAVGTPSKSWLSTRDGDVRASHQRIDAETSTQPIKMDAPFVLTEEGRGRAELQYPGDPAAPAWAVVNCRCALVPEEEQVLAAYAAACKREVQEYAGGVK